MKNNKEALDEEVYNEPRAQFLDSVISHLKKTEKPDLDAFCVHLKIPYKDLSLSVEPIGQILFPVTPKIAKTLITEAEPAKYGYKENTLVDRKVRDTWEISKEFIHIDRHWDEHLAAALKTIQKKLNLPEEGTLKADLHNLLIYMPGQFFKPHQDTEKAEDMLATLIVVLPSEFTGGELIIDQHGDKKKFIFAEPKDALNLVSFYSDCYHEVKEVKTGYRLALTYNLFYKSRSNSLKTNKNPGLEKAVQSYFDQSQHAKSDYIRHPLKLVYLLDHHYTRNSLEWNCLRGSDREKVSCLLACADNLGLTAHLSLADVHETWSTESNDWEWRHHRRWREDDEVGIEGTSTPEYRLIELIDDEIILRHWIARTGNKFPERDLYVQNEMVCWTKAVDQFQPFKSDYEGYMGNYGDTLDRWYHRGAIVLWKKEDDLINLFICDKKAALQNIVELLKMDLKQGHQAIHQILPYWPQDVSLFIDPEYILEFVTFVRDYNLASTLLKTLGISTLNKKNASKFLELISSYGEEWLLSITDFWRENQRYDFRESNMKELSPLLNQFGGKHKKITQWLLSDQYSSLVKNDIHEKKYSGRKEIRKSLPKKLKNLEELLRLSYAFGEIKIHDRLVSHLLNEQSIYPEVNLINLFISIDETVYLKPLKELVIRLKKEKKVPRKRGDWSIQDVIPDNCSDCEYLKIFLTSSATQKIFWPLAKDRRAHIHEIIDQMDIPVTHETIHTGSPHKLVLTKTSELFTREESRAQAIEACLARVRQLKISGEIF